MRKLHYEKRFLSILLSLCMVLALFPATAFAEDNEEPTETSICTCDTACSAEAMNTDCPICGVEGATAENCGKYEAPVKETEPEQTALEMVQSMLDALPTVEELKDADEATVNAAYEVAQNAYDALETLKPEEQEQITGVKKLAALMDWFNGQVTLLGADDQVTLSYTSAGANISEVYNDLLSALEAVKRLSNATDITVTAGKNISRFEQNGSSYTLPTGKYTVILNPSKGNHDFYFRNSTEDNGYCAITVPQNADVTIKSGLGKIISIVSNTITVNGKLTLDHAAPTCAAYNDASVNIDGGTVQLADYAEIRANVTVKNRGKLNISGAYASLDSKYDGTTITRYNLNVESGTVTMNRPNGSTRISHIVSLFGSEAKLTIGKGNCPSDSSITCSAGQLDIQSGAKIYCPIELSAAGCASISGGEVKGTITVKSGATFNCVGGTVKNLVVEDGGTVNHTGGTATCMEKAVCTVCGKTYGVLDSTNHAGTLSKWQIDGNGHWKTYSCCPSVKVAEGGHNYVGGKCECGAVKYTVTFDANGGSVTPTTATTDISGKLTSLPIPARNGYRFTGWYTDKIGGTLVTESNIFTAHTTVYAHLMAYPANAPTVLGSDTEVTYGQYTDKKIGVTVTNQEGYTYSYQWYDSSKNKIAGATESTYTIPNNLTAGSHDYYCVVTAKRSDNNETATTEKKITVTVNKGAAVLTEPTAQNDITYGATLDTVGLTKGWTWADGTTQPTVINSGYVAYYTPDDTANYDWTAVAGWNATENRVERTVAVTVKKANQSAPSGIINTAETVDGKADGKITGVTSAMEYRKDGDTIYTAITGTEITGLEDGTYYIRYKTADNYNVSNDVIITITAGRKLTVTVPTTQAGYTLTVNKTALVWNDSVELTFALAEGYSKLDTFAVNVNGDPVTPDANGKYTVTNAQSDITVTVVGVADVTAPTAEIKLGENHWNKLLNNVAFGLYFKDMQKVTITATDMGSGVDKIYYYLSTTALTEEQVKALADSDWTEYNGEFNLNFQDEYIIYAKAVDKDNNKKYISSEQGIVIDSIAPVISGIVNGETHYGDTAFEVTDKHIDEVKVDGNPVTLTGGKYTITADGQEHTVVVTDKSGNASAEIKITVIIIASLDDKIESITTDNVKSSDKKVIEDVQSFVNGLIAGGKDFTDTEDTQLANIKANTETLLKKISDVSAEMNSLDSSVNAYDINNVKSDDKATINGLIAKIDTLLNGNNLTADEKEAMAALKTTAQGLIKRIDDTASKTSDLTGKVNAYNKDKVKSTNKDAINGLIEEMTALINGNNLNDTEKENLGNVKTTAESLIKKIDDTADEIKAVTDSVNGYNKDTVKSENKQDIENLITRIDTLTETDNVTETEKSVLADVKATAQELIGKIDDTAKKITDLTEDVNTYDKNKVTSEDKQDITNLIADIDKLLEEDNLNKSEKEELGKVKDTATALVERIGEATNSSKTDNTDKVKDITSENVETKDKSDLEKAKDDLEKALENYKDNLTDDEKKDIQAEIDRIEKALEVIDKVKKVEDLINKLPDNIAKSDADAIKKADDAYNALSKYEQSILDKNAKKKLDNAKSALGALNKSTNSPATGDNGNIWMWFALFFVSGGALVNTAIYGKKKKRFAK